MSLLLSYLLKLREHLHYDTELGRKLYENDTYRKFCGFTYDAIPSHDTFSRFFRMLTYQRLTRLFETLGRYLNSLGAFDDDQLAIEATDVLSNARNRHNMDPDAG